MKQSLQSLRRGKSAMFLLLLIAAIGCCMSPKKVNAQTLTPCGTITGTGSGTIVTIVTDTLYCPNITMAYVKYSYFDMNTLTWSPEISVPASAMIVGTPSATAITYKNTAIQIQMSALQDPSGVGYFRFSFDYATTLGCESDKVAVSMINTPLALKLLKLQYAGAKKMLVTTDFDNPDDITSLWIEIADDDHMVFKKEVELIPSLKSQAAYISHNGFYRLYSENAEGQKSYSNTMEIKDLSYMDYVVQQFPDRIICRATAQTGASLYSIEGQMIRSASGASLSLVGLPSGIYIYRPNLRGVQSQKIVIQ